MTAPTITPRTRTARRRWLLGPAALLALALASPAIGASPSPDASPAPAAPAGSPAAPAGSPAAPAGSPSAPAASQPATSPGASASPAGSPLPSLPAVRLGTLPAEGGLLEPGDYQDWSLGPTLSFTVGDGWAATPVDAGYGLALVGAGQSAPAVLTFTEFEGLVFEDPCQATTEATLPIDLTPEALAADLAQSPYLVVGEPTETTVAGYPALKVELTTQQPMGCDPPATWIWASKAGGGFVLEDGEQATLLLLTVGDRVLVAAIEAYPGVDFEAFAEAAMAIVDSLEIDPSTDVPGGSPAPGASTVPAASPLAEASASPAP